MEHIDAKVFALITLGTAVAVSILKAFMKRFVEGKEEAWSQLLPVIFTVGAKMGGLFKSTEWVDALLFAVGGGLGANIVHDKLGAVLKMAKGFLGGSGGTPPSDPAATPPPAP
jgi:hypothetical protein